jgi:hypothetical protein
MMNATLKYSRICSVFVVALMICSFSIVSGQSAFALASGDSVMMDADFDRMPDEWEIAFGLNPHMPDAGADDDGDGFSNYDEYAARTDPLDAHSAPIYIQDTIPQPYAGSANNARVENTTSLGVLIVSVHGIDLTYPDSIRFSIDDAVHPVYDRDLSSASVRVVKLNNDDDITATRFWAVYDRSLETYLPQTYAFDAHVSISVDIQDIFTNTIIPAEIDFKIESRPGHKAAAQSLPQTDFVDPSDPLLEGVYDTGIQVVSGPLKGAKIIYNSSEPLPPVFGPMDEIAAVDADDLEAVGVPINLRPQTVFNTPVKVILPIPDAAAAENIGIYFHNGMQWQPACDPTGDVLAAGDGWMQPASLVTRNNNDDDSAIIGVDVHHSAGVQAVIFAAFNSFEDDETDRKTSGTTVFINCFITTAAADQLAGYRSPASGFWLLVAGGLWLLVAGLRCQERTGFRV